jgi:hypothetical protein
MSGIYRTDIRPQGLSLNSCPLQQNSQGSMKSCTVCLSLCCGVLLDLIWCHRDVKSSRIGHYLQSTQWRTWRRAGPYHTQDTIGLSGSLIDRVSQQSQSECLTTITPRLLQQREQGYCPLPCFPWGQRLYTHTVLPL